MTALRSRFALAAAALLVPALAGCGFDAPTDQVYNQARGVNGRDGQVDVLNALVVSPADGVGTVVATLVNNDTEQEDRLVRVTVGQTEAEITTADDGTIIPPRGLNNLAVSGSVTTRDDSVVAGAMVDLTFTFQNGEAVTLTAPVVPHEGDYAEVPLPGTR